MNLRTTLILGVLCVIALSLVLTSERHRREWFLRDLDQPFNFPLESLVRLEVRGRNPVIACVQRTTGWWLEEPLEFRASQATLERLVLALRELRVRSELPEERPEYELGGAPLEVAFTVGSAQHRLLLGAAHPDLPMVFAALVVGDGPRRCVLVDRALRDVFSDLRVAEVRDDVLVDISAARARRVSWTVADAAGPLRAELVRGEAGWRLLQPLVADANEAAVRRFLDVFNAWCIEEFVADDVDSAALETSYGLGGSALALEIEEQRSGRVRALRIGAPGPPDEDGGERVYVAVPGAPHVFLASAEVLVLLRQPPDSYRDRALFRLATPDLRRLLVDVPASEELAARQVVFEEVHGAWQVSLDAGPPVPVDPDWFKDLCEALRLGQAASFFPWDDEARRNLQRFGFDQPLRVRWEAPDGNVEELWAGTAVPDRPGEDYLLNLRWTDTCATGVLPGGPALRTLPWSGRTPELLGWAPERIEELSIREAGGRTLELVRPHERWLRKGRREGVAAGVLEPVLSTLASLRARWEPPGPGAPGPENFRLRIEIGALRDSPNFTPRVLYVGAALPGGQRLVRDGAGPWILRAHQPPDGLDPFAALEQVILELVGP